MRYLCQLSVIANSIGGTYLLPLEIAFFDTLTFITGGLNVPRARFGHFQVIVLFIGGGETF